MHTCHGPGSGTLNLKQTLFGRLHLPQKGASTGPVPRQEAVGQLPSTLQGSFAPLSPSDTQPLLEIVAVL